MNTMLIHPTAVVHPNARLGRDTEIGPYAVIEEEVVIGERCCISSHAVVKRYTRMGDDNQVFEGAILGGTAQDLKCLGGRSYLRIGDRNILREGVTVHRATEPEGETRIGNDNYLMAHAHVAHNCILGDRITIVNNVGLAGHIYIEDHAFIAGGAGIHQFCRVGTHSMIGGNSKVTQDVLPFLLIDGIPGRVRGLNLVGLKRAGFSNDEIRALKRAYHILFQVGQNLNEKLNALREIDSHHVRHLVSFIRNSERGFCQVERATDSG